MFLIDIIVILILLYFLLLMTIFKFLIFLYIFAPIYLRIRTTYHTTVGTNLLFAEMM